MTVLDVLFDAYNGAEIGWFFASSILFSQNPVPEVADLRRLVEIAESSLTHLTTDASNPISVND